jgi:hypothetical protein
VGSSSRKRPYRSGREVEARGSATSDATVSISSSRWGGFLPPCNFLRSFLISAGRRRWGGRAGVRRRILAHRKCVGTRMQRKTGGERLATPPAGQLQPQ